MFKLVKISARQWRYMTPLQESTITAQRRTLLNASKNYRRGVKAMKQKEDFTGKVHLVYGFDKIANRFMLTGFGYGYYKPTNYKPNSRFAVIIANEYKITDGDNVRWEYRNLEVTYMYNPNIIGQYTRS